MPECKKCGSWFHSRIEVDGVVRFVHKRKYCLECSPFGQHNTRQIHLLNRARIDRSHEWQKKVRRERKEKLVKLMGGKCSICDYDRFNGALHFHHVDPESKEFTLAVTQLSNMSWKKIVAEAKKTVLVCAVCHAEIEGGLHDEFVAKWKKNPV